MNRRIIPLIMCGGAGTRLWPASREVHPKQFLPLFGPRSTFQDTHPAGVGCGAVRASDRHHQHRLSLHGAGATGRDRARGRCPAGADAAGFRSGDRGRRGLCAEPRRRGGRAGARRRSRRPRYRRLCRRLPRRVSRRPKPARIVTFGVAPERAATEYGYINPGEVDFRRSPQRRKIRREAGSANAAEYVKAGYLWNSGNFMFRAVGAARRIPQRRCRQRAGRHRCRDQSRTRSRIRHARCRRVRIGQGDLDRLCRDGKDLARRGGAGGLRLVRCRLLARGVGTVGQGRPGQRRAGRRRVRGFPQLQRLDRQGAGGAGGRRRSRRRGDAGRRAGVAPEGRQRPEAAGGEAEDRRARR